MFAVFALAVMKSYWAGRGLGGACGIGLEVVGFADLLE
jgi:hypothetical protein